MRCKCIKCGKTTKNIPFNIEKKNAKGWYWTTRGMMCSKCYNKSTESLVSKNEIYTLENSNNGLRY